MSTIIKGIRTLRGYTQEDVAEARVALEQHELEIGEYTMIPDMYNGNIEEYLE